jgi:non-heme chloroperoxidase
MMYPGSCRTGLLRTAKAVPVSPVAPVMVRTPACPGGPPMKVFDGIRAVLLKVRSRFFQDLSIPSSVPTGNARRSARECGTASENRDDGRIRGLHESVAAFSETDLTGALKKMPVPTLVIHGDDDQIVPLGNAGLVSPKVAATASL